MAAFSLAFNQMKSGNTRQRAYQVVLFIGCHWMPSGAASYCSYSNFEYECIDILTLQCQFVWRCSTRMASARLFPSKLTVLEPTTTKISNRTCKNLLVARIYCWDSNQAIWYANKYLAGEGFCQIMHLYPLGHSINRVPALLWVISNHLQYVIVPSNPMNSVQMMTSKSCN